jgi:serine phosphatase RsbU (regulator of sigma subunit)
MEFNRFQWAVIARVIGLSLSLFILFFSFFRTNYIFLNIFLLVIIILQIYGLIHYVQKIYRDLIRFFRSIEHNDFTQSYSFKHFGSSFQELSEALSRISERFLRLRAEKEENFQYLQTVVQNVRTGVVAFHSDGEIMLMNNASKRLLGVPSLKHMKMLAKYDPELTAILLRLQPGESTSLKIQKDDTVKYLAVNATRFKLNEKSYTLLSLQDIKSEIERERMVRELEIARQIQHRLFPRANPSLPGFDIAGTCIPAREVGGDYYDFISDDTGKLGIVIGDVSGKGLPASIYMTLTKGVFLSYVNEKIDPRTLLIRINRFMYQSMERNVFVTLYFGVLNPETRELTLARAGHLPALFYSGREDQFTMIEPKGIGLGLEHGEIFEKTIDSSTISMTPGDCLVFYTDGLSEAMNRRGEEYGEDRMQNVIRKNIRSSSSQIIEKIIQDVRNFRGDNDLYDDLTVIVIKAE